MKRIMILGLLVTKIFAMDNDNDRSFLHFNNSSLVMNYKESNEDSHLLKDFTDNKSRKYKCGQFCAASYPICCYQKDRFLNVDCMMGALVSIIPSWIVGWSTFGPVCFSAAPPCWAWALAGTLTPIAYFTYPAWKLGNFLTFFCAENCTSCDCRDFLAPKYQLDYEWSVRVSLQALEETIIIWNNHMTSKENNSTEVIDMFLKFIKENYDIELDWMGNVDLNWSDLDKAHNSKRMFLLQEKLHAMYKQLKGKNPVKEILLDFYKNDPNLQPKNFDVIAYYDRRA